MRQVLREVENLIGQPALAEDVLERAKALVPNVSQCENRFHRALAEPRDVLIR
jgi:hypothetical protein